MSLNVKKKRKTHKQRILEHLQAGHSLMRLEAWHKLGILDPSTRISDLKADGHNIKTEMVKVKNKYGETVSIASWSLEPSFIKFSDRNSVKKKSDLKVKA